jgi:hypothetical protein
MRDAKKWVGGVGALASDKLGGCVGAVQVSGNLGLAVILKRGAVAMNAVEAEQW